MNDKTEETKTPTLSEFVRTAILDIAAGLKEAQDKGRELGVKINPDSYGDRSTPTEIEFDLSVSSITQEKGTGGIKIGVSNILGMDKAKEGTSGTESSSRIHFVMPVHFVVYNAPHSQRPSTPVKRVTTASDGI